jgi:hypothetical protein
LGASSSSSIIRSSFIILYPQTLHQIADPLLFFTPKELALFDEFAGLALIPA